MFRQLTLTALALTLACGGDAEAPPADGIPPAIDGGAAPPPRPLEPRPDPEPDPDPPAKPEPEPEPDVPPPVVDAGAPSIDGGPGPDPEPDAEPPPAAPGLFDACEAEAECPPELTCATSPGHDGGGSFGWVCRPRPVLTEGARCELDDECVSANCDPDPLSSGQRYCNERLPLRPGAFCDGTEDDCDGVCRAQSAGAIPVIMCCIDLSGPCV